MKDESAGEVLVLVDTDMAVPREIARLRVDLYSADGAWYASHDVSRARLEDWPASFGVFADNGSAERVVTVRVRAYPEGKVRDYRGERFVPRPTSGAPLDLVPEPVPTDKPRLLSETGVDATPGTEPEPLLTIDRLVRVRVRSDQRGWVKVVLPGACVGTMADLANGTSCIDTEDVRVPAPELLVTAGAPPPDPSLAGAKSTRVECTYTPRARSTAADGTPLYDDEVCVPGDRFVFGSIDSIVTDYEDLPERFVVVPPFLMDRFEVTVGRWRAALAKGFVSPDATPTPNEGPIPAVLTPYTDPSMCSWSTTPQNRETFALTCVSDAAARAFCAFEGGEVPSEVEWEYAAGIAERPFRTRFPWGGDDTEVPTCDRAIWGRGELYGQLCVVGAPGDGFGPLPVDARAATDVTPVLGIVGLGGGVCERTRDAIIQMTATCWAAAPLVLPGCDVPSPFHSVRGGSWHDSAISMRASVRRTDLDRTSGLVATSDIGFRCVRRPK